MVAMANDRSNLLFIEDGINQDGRDDDTPVKSLGTAHGRKQSTDKNGGGRGNRPPSGKQRAGQNDLSGIDKS